MYNPLALINEALIKVLIASPTIFVREYYHRGADGKDLPLLLTYYDKENEVEKTRALFHYQQLKGSRYAYLYDSTITSDKEKLLKAASMPIGYQIYINMLPGPWMAPPVLKKQIHAYMLQHLPWWNYTKSYQLHIHLKDRFGQLYLQLSWKANKAEVLLEEIENVSLCATT